MPEISLLPAKLVDLGIKANPLLLTPDYSADTHSTPLFLPLSLSLAPAVCWHSLELDLELANRGHLSIYKQCMA